MTQNKHGGARKGSGRPFVYNEPTKVIRVPESRVLEIKKYLKKNDTPKFNDISSITLLETKTHYEIPVALQKARDDPRCCPAAVQKTLRMPDWSPT